MSRMERYYKFDDSTKKRSSKNQELYKSIYELGEYSNIEGIATIDKSNEIDITKVKNMLKNREEYQKQRDFNNITARSIPKPTNYEIFETEEERVYDIRDILEKAKINKPEKESYKSLNNTNFEILKEIREKNNQRTTENDLQDLIDTISETSQLNKLSDHELGLNMFDTLKSSNNTIVDSNTSIRNLLEDVKKNEQKQHENTTTNLDKSFFTSGLNFNDDDFEQIAELNKSVKKNNFMIKILFVMILIAIAIAIIIIVFQLIK